MQSASVRLAKPIFGTTLERPMKENSIRRAVREGRAALGTGIKEFASRGIPWIIEASGFDYCNIDHEHGAFDLETIADLAGWYGRLHSILPDLRVVGGCCGTDHQHVTAIAEALVGV